MSSTKKTIYGIVERPLITEKGAVASSQNNSFVFRVHRLANKNEIKNAVEKIFNVNVVAVRTLNYLGKNKRVGVRMGRQNNWKKAYVSLQAGQTIDTVEGL